MNKRVSPTVSIDEVYDHLECELPWTLDTEFLPEELFEAGEKLLQEILNAVRRALEFLFPEGISSIDHFNAVRKTHFTRPYDGRCKPGSLSFYETIEAYLPDVAIDEEGYNIAFFQEMSFLIREEIMICLHSDELRRLREGILGEVKSKNLGGGWGLSSLCKIDRHGRKKPLLGYLKDSLKLNMPNLWFMRDVFPHLAAEDRQEVSTFTKKHLGSAKALHEFNAMVEAYATDPQETSDPEFKRPVLVPRGTIAPSRFRRLPIEKPNHPVLTPEEERELFEQLAKGGAISERAKARIVERNQGLVWSIALRHEYALAAGMQLTDLIQEGNIGLFRAIEKFELERGWKFSTYATWWIRQGVIRAVYNNSRTIRLPVYIYEELSELRKYERVFQVRHDRKPTDEELAVESEMSVERIQKLRNASKRVKSLDMPIGEDGGTRLIEITEDQDAVGLYDRTERENIRTAVHRRLDASDLTEREKDVVRRRFGLTSLQEQESLERISASYGVTREWIRQLELKAFRTLRQDEEFLRLYEEVL